MDHDRKIVVLGGIFFLFLCTIGLIIGGKQPVALYWGIPAGIIFGFGTCIYLADVWDPRLLASRTKMASSKILWFVPLGILAAKLSSYILGEFISWMLVGVFIPWIYITFSYFIIQAWRYR